MEEQRKILISKLNLMETYRAKLYQHLTPCSYEDLNKKVNIESWSIIQIIDHLRLSEQLSVDYCRKKLSFSPQLKEAGFIESLKVPVISFYTLYPFRFSAPRIISTDFLVEEDDLHLMFAKWDATRSNLRMLLVDTPDQYLNALVLKHPAFGRLSYANMLYAMQKHVERHMNQILKIVKTLC